MRSGRGLDRLPWWLCHLPFLWLLFLVVPGYLTEARAMWQGLDSPSGDGSDTPDL